MSKQAEKMANGGASAHVSPREKTSQLANDKNIACGLWD